MGTLRQRVSEEQGATSSQCAPRGGEIDSRPQYLLKISENTPLHRPENGF